MRSWIIAIVAIAVVALLGEAFQRLRFQCLARGQLGQWQQLERKADAILDLRHAGGPLALWIGTQRFFNKHKGSLRGIAALNGFCGIDRLIHKMGVDQVGGG